MTKDQIIAELFFRFRYAKRLLQIDHPTCDVQRCGQPSVGCHVAAKTITQQVVVALCEMHWLDVVNASPALWRVRWDEFEEANSVLPTEEESEET